MSYFELTGLIYVPNDDNGAQVGQPEGEKSPQSSATPCHEGDFAIYALHFVLRGDECLDDAVKYCDDRQEQEANHLPN